MTWPGPFPASPTGCSPERLKDLEAGGLVERVVHPSTPVQVEYRLTAKGAALGGVLLHLNQWALDWITLPDKGAGDPEPP